MSLSNNKIIGFSQELTSSKLTAACMISTGAGGVQFPTLAEMLIGQGTISGIIFYDLKDSLLTRASMKCSDVAMVEAADTIYAAVEDSSTLAVFFLTVVRSSSSYKIQQIQLQSSYTKTVSPVIGIIGTTAELILWGRFNT
jgi:hypothetical protein